MAYLNANIPVTYAQIRREYLYDLKEHHGEVEDCIIFGLSSITGRPILFHTIMKMVRSFIDFLSPRSFKEDLEQIKFLDIDLMSWSCGIASVTILALLLLIS